MAPDERVFDRPHYQAFEEPRMALLRNLLPQWKAELDLQTALDMGCGLGHFSGLLRELGFDVRAVEGRAENADEARRRVPGLNVLVENAESPSLAELGSFDLVLCLGLLYHLENPFRTIRTLRALTGKLVVIDSMCVEGDLPSLHLKDEGFAEDQGLQYVAFYPTEACLVKMLYRAGFAAVGKPVRLPDHPEFYNRMTQKMVRTMLVASAAPFVSPLLRSIPEPQGLGDPWTTPLGMVAAKVAPYARFMKKPWSRKMAILRQYFGMPEAGGR